MIFKLKPISNRVSSITNFFFAAIGLMENRLEEEEEAERRFEFCRLTKADVIL